MTFWDKYTALLTYILSLGTLCETAFCYRQWASFIHVVSTLDRCYVIDIYTM